jgi:hypothetical protein
MKYYAITKLAQFTENTFVSKKSPRCVILMNGTDVFVLNGTGRRGRC